MNKDCIFLAKLSEYDDKKYEKVSIIFVIQINGKYKI